jgi:predicted lysophospholipase L1 biosynthesis ABC-type transport system permease subunit
MEHRNRGNGLETFLEHWGFLLVALVSLAVLQLLMFFLNLNSKLWIYFFVASVLILFSGAAMIIRAKIPVYRSGRFLTFGVKSVPERLAGCYRWGWRVFLLGVALALCLLLSRQ